MALESFDFESLYSGHKMTVLWNAQKLLNDWDAAEEVTQEAFVRYLHQLEEGGKVEHPKSFILTIAQRLCFEKLEESRRPPLEESAKEPWLLAVLTQASHPPSQLEEHDRVWSSMIYWGQRMIATIGNSKKQKERLRVLMDTSSREQAFEKFEQMGLSWNRTAVSMMLGRASRRVDLCMDELVERGPQDSLEQLHWPFLRQALESIPRSEANSLGRGGLLSWLVRHFNKMPPAERHQLVFRLFYTPSNKKE